MDAQPSTDGKFLISITGQLLVRPISLTTYLGCLISHGMQVDEEANPMPFTQFFQLAPDGGSYFVYVLPRQRYRIRIRSSTTSFCSLNDIFRLNLG